MLGLDFLEWTALLHIVFVELDASHIHGTLIRAYFWVVSVSMLVQIAGAALVYFGWYRLGGILQIVSSSIHVFKGEGIIGIVGGVKAYRYPSQVAQLAGAGEPTAATA
jgi:hypothetical protein